MEQRGRVLIVDDNRMNVDVLRHILRKDYDFETAFNGDECLAKLPVFSPQVVLLDIMMPGIDGYEVCRRIKSGSLGEGVHVILVSGKGMAADRVRGYEAQADDYIVKPFDHDELLSKVRAHFRQLTAMAGADRATAREALVQLCELIKQMSAAIGEHTDVIEAIQQELEAFEDPDSDAIVRVMIRLADTNKATQSRLVSAERKLRDEAKNIESHAVEARTDALTLLPNRRAFDEELLRRVAEVDRIGGHLCAAMIDVDNFKPLNDQYGHQAGDEALKAVGRVLGKAFRQMDLVARYGGDEFAALMPAVSIADVLSVVGRIREAMEHSVVILANQTLRITASIGLAEHTAGEAAISLLKRADAALYASKKAGKNRGSWHDGMDSHPIGDAMTQDTRQTAVEQSQRSPPLAPSNVKGTEIAHAPLTG